MDQMTMYNPKRRRYAARVGFGWAIYACDSPDDQGNVRATRRGIVENEAAARRWVHDGENLNVTRVEDQIWISTWQEAPSHDM